MNEIRCPWCGQKMELEHYGIDEDEWFVYVCPDCAAQSPISYSAESALATALSRPLQKPLTLEEALHEVSIWFECGVVGKSYFFEFSPAFLNKINDELVDIYQENGNVFSQHIENYMKCWRCWAIKPTEEERKAATWE